MGFGFWFIRKTRSYYRRRPSLAGWYGPSDSAIICWYRIEAEVRSPSSRKDTEE